ncbi:hypothetical protein B0H10DRAFT_2241383 [Mycena sp. CBHHK59/15]|nr:hypothetical protein B0H10DRAFT_2241383 [Mycena sp. CBHHK59/15]
MAEVQRIPCPVHLTPGRQHGSLFWGRESDTSSASCSYLPCAMKRGKTVVGAVCGEDGSTVTTSSGESFVYWLADPANPFLTGAKPNSWTPALNESWT